ncbi:MAG: TolB family protein, partial [Maribacter sp.]
MKNQLLLILFIGCLSFVNSQTKTNLELTDIFNMEFVSDPQISPDGNQILYVRNFKDVMTDKNLSNIWIVNSDGTKNRPITIGNQNDMYPRWS